MTCKNCSREVEAHFCSNCGQRTTVDKLTVSSLASQLAEGVFQLNRGFFFTLKELLIRPGHSIREFLAGKRKNHFKPIAYTFLISTIYFFLSQALGTETVLNDLISGFAEGGGKKSDLAALNWLADRYSYIILLFLPIYAFASFASFKSAQYNFVEHIVLNAYIIGQQTFIYIVYAVLSRITGETDLLALAAVSISVSYQFFVFWQFFDKLSNITVILRLVATYLFYTLFLTPMIMIALWMFSIIK